MPGTLHVVATPIGNLEDITLRALRVLREVSLIAAEDTRHTAKLLSHFGIQTRTVSYHEHNYRSRRELLLARLRDGDDLALVTDAGTPGVSDPGADLVRVCLEQGIPVNPVPGPSAMLAAAVGSGFPLVPFTFLGFVPSRAKDRSRWLSAVAGVSHTVCFFESPHRILITLHELNLVLGNRHIVVARELTKVHQELITGSITAICQAIPTPKGEFTIVVGPPDVSESRAKTVADDQQVIADFCQMHDSGAFGSKRALVSALAKQHGRSARDIYQLLLSRREQHD